VTLTWIILAPAPAPAPAQDYRLVVTSVKGMTSCVPTVPRIDQLCHRTLLSAPPPPPPPYPLTVSTSPPLPPSRPPSPHTSQAGCCPPAVICPASCSSINLPARKPSQPPSQEASGSPQRQGASLNTRTATGAAGNGVWCEGRKQDWFCTHIGCRPLTTASALASLLHLLVETCAPPPPSHAQPPLDQAAAEANAMLIAAASVAAALAGSPCSSSPSLSCQGGAAASQPPQQQHLKEALQAVAAEIGESGIVTAVVAKLQGLLDSVEASTQQLQRLKTLQVRPTCMHS